MSGMYLGIFYFICNAYLAYFSTYLLVQAGNISNKFSYSDLAKSINTKFGMFVNIIFMINNWGFLVSAIVLVNKLAAKIVELYVPSAPYLL